MPIPFMIESVVFIPNILSYLLLVGLLLVGIKEFRQGHIGRIGIVVNAFLLWQIFYGDWSKLPIIFQWYLNMGTILALVAIPSYLFRFKLPKEFYQIAFLGYGSISILIVIFIQFVI